MQAFLILKLNQGAHYLEKNRETWKLADTNSLGNIRHLKQNC